MIDPARARRRLLIAVALGVTLLFIWSARLLPWDYSSTIKSAKDSFASDAKTGTSMSASAGTQKGLPSTDIVLPQVENYFEQAFSAKHPRPYDYPMLKDTCDKVKWRDDDVYLKCGGMSAGLTSIISEIKVCFKMAVDTGANLVLPSMPLRDSTDLKDFNFLNGDAYLPYDKWFDADHLKEQMGKACPKMKIIHPDDLDKTVPVKDHWHVSIGDAPGYTFANSYFWVGRPYRNFFEERYAKLQELAALDANRDKSKAGITVVDVDAMFLLYRIGDDPTGRELKLWNDLAHLVRFRDQERQIIDRLRQKMPRPHYGVHFRVENDTIWSSLEHQLGVDLDALDRAWKIYGRPEQEKPLVYLACGDQDQVKKFVDAGAERGWEVTHKWRLAEGDAELTNMINALAFDFQGAIDMGIMIRSQFFLGIQGSAFSTTVAHMRDITGRYRGSSFDVYDDESARSHLFSEYDAGQYACCL